MIGKINDILWVITTFFIIYVSIFYTIRLLFPQFRCIKMLKIFTKNSKDDNSFKVFSLTLGGKIGVGSISGIALCIYLGGIESLFWLWISAFILAVLPYVETHLGIKYKDKKTKLQGPSFYIEKGLNKKNLAKAYSVLLIIAYIVAFISIQSSTVVILTESTLHIDKILIIIILCIVTYFSINKGIKKISKITEILVPTMTIIYIIIGIIVVLNNFNQTKEIFTNIVKEALSFNKIGKSVLVPIIVGVERGIFATESGIGTTATASALSNNTEKTSYVGIISSLFTSLIICTITALIILTSNYESLIINDINGIEIVSYAFFEHFGHLGEYFLLFIIILFAFSTIVTCYYYGEVNACYLLNRNKISILKIIVIIVIIYSSLTNPTIIWKFADIIVALLTLINIYSMYKLKDK